MRILHFLASLSVVCLAWLCCGVAEAGVKAPFEGAFTPEQVNAGSGETVAVRLVFSTYVSYPELSVALVIPDGLRLLQGTPRFVLRDLATQEKYVADYEFEVLGGDEQRVIATLKATSLSGDESVAMDFHLLINPRPEKANYQLIETNDGQSIRLHKIP